MILNNFKTWCGNCFKWSRWNHHQRRHFLLNVFWGVVIAILLHFAHHTGMGQSILNNAYDSLVVKDFKKSFLETQNDGTGSFSERICLIAFDRNTYESSPSEGYWTPRILLGRAINKAVEQGARVVIVDFGVHRPIPSLCVTKNLDHDSNNEFLKLIAQAAKTAKKTGAVIILPHNGLSSITTQYGERYQQLLSKNRDVLKVGSVVAYQNPNDFKVRHLSFFELQGKKQQKVSFSMQVLAAIYMNFTKAEAEMFIKSTLLPKISSGDSIVDVNILKNNGTKTLFTMHRQDVHKECLSARYIYRLVPMDVARHLICGSNSDCSLEDPYVRNPNLMLTPYELLATVNDLQLYKNKAVIIGSTYGELGDVHLTPLGKMSGIFLLANGLNMLLSDLQIHEPSLFFQLLMEAVIISVIALVFLHISPAMASLSLIAMIFLVNTTLSLILFTEYGLFLNFWIPIIGVGFHENITIFESFANKLLRK